VGRRSWHIAVVTLGLGVAACDSGGVSVDPTPVSTTTTPPTPEEPSDGVYRLGVLLPTDGDGKTLGDALVAGADAAKASLEEAGGVAGLPIEVVYHDEPADPSAAVDVVESMIENDDIDALVGPASSRNALAVLDPVVANGLLTCSPTATAIELTDFDDNGFFVRTIGSDRLMAQAMAQAIDALGITRASVLFPNDDYGVDVAEALRDDLGTRDITDVQLVRYTPDAALVTAIDEALHDNPQAMAVIGSLSTGAAALAELRSRPLGVRVPTVVSDGMRSSELGALVDPTNTASIDGVTGVAPNAEPASWLVTQLQQNGADVPVAYAAYAYDCVNLLALAAEAAGSDDPAAAEAQIEDVSGGGFSCSTFADCREQLSRGANIDYNGASGQLELNEQGDVTQASYDVFEYVGGVDVKDRSVPARL
jgi:branched-chain amino acid transport system substrate-binding protein